MIISVAAVPINTFNYCFMFYDVLCFLGSRIQQTSGSQNLDAILTQQLEEKLRAAKVAK